MTAGIYDIIIEKGATWNPIITWQNNDGTAIDLTGYSARLQVREPVTASTTLISLTSGSGITLGGTAGTIALLLSATDTAALSFEKGVYDLELVSGGGIVYRLLQGRVNVSSEVTR